MRLFFLLMFLIGCGHSKNNVDAQAPVAIMNEAKLASVVDADFVHRLISLSLQEVDGDMSEEERAWLREAELRVKTPRHLCRWHPIPWWKSGMISHTTLKTECADRQCVTTLRDEDVSEHGYIRTAFSEAGEMIAAMFVRGQPSDTSKFISVPEVKCPGLLQAAIENRTGEDIFVFHDAEDEATMGKYGDGLFLHVKRLCGDEAKVKVEKLGDRWSCSSLNDCQAAHQCGNWCEGIAGEEVDGRVVVSAHYSGLTAGGGGTLKVPSEKIAMLRGVLSCGGETIVDIHDGIEVALRFGGKRFE